MSQQWFFDWDNARVHTDAVVSSWFDAHGVQRLKHAPYSPILAPTDFVLLKKNKMGDGRPEPGLGQLQERLGGGRQTSDRHHFAAAFRSFEERCKKGVRLGGKFFEKS